MERDVSDCAWCSLPAVETATLVVGGEEFELDLCDQHIDELISGSRLARCAGFSLPRRRRTTGERTSSQL
jgi:hypothetical protein